MNIVKGVADLIRRTSSGPIGVSVSGSQANWSHPPGPKIRFGEVGDEAILNELWVRCEKAADKGERKRLFYVFLKQFIVAYKNWKPINSGWLSEDASTSVENLSTSDHTVGCSSGHPAEIILKLSEELKQLTSLIIEWRSTADLHGASIGLNLTSEGFLVLDALAIVMRSMHNCKVFGYYSGIQKLTALMKGAVIQLKTIAGELSVDEGVSNIVVENTRLLQKMLKYVVSIIHIFIDIDSLLYVEDHSLSMKVPTCEERLMWRQKAVVLVMEAGGINWLVELLRVTRRLNIKEQNIEVELQFLALKILYSALSENPRGQNHFKSIGGLEVLLDGLGLPSKIVLAPKDPAGADQKRDESRFLNILQLHVLSLAVLREAVFGNLNNMQFLCENGRVHKFANSFCSPAFMLQEYKLQIGELSGQYDFRWPILDCKYNVAAHSGECSVVPLTDLTHVQSWNKYVVKLCKVLCSFLLAPEDVKPHHPQASSVRIMTPVSLVYGDLSIKWVMRVLVAVFPCIRACSNQNDLPAHLRILANALQHSVLAAFRKFLVSSPASLEIFREEGIWDLFFSENFFYFGHAFEDFSLECCTNNDDDSLEKHETYYATSSNSPLKVEGVDVIQMEVISFVEFASTTCGTAHNLSACNPEVVIALSKSLLRILQISSERTVASFKTLNGVPRLLKVACVQAQEHRRYENVILSEINFVGDIQSRSNQGHDSRETGQSYLTCLETIMEVFTEFFSIGDEAKNLVMLSSTSIDCLFDLFWEETLRSRVLKHTLELMKIKPISEEDQKAKLYICTKYLEMFAQIKEREKSSTELSIDLLVGIREMLLNDPQYYQTLFRDGECFLHIVSLLNGNVDEANGEKLILNVLQTLTCLLAKNEVSKASFRALAGKGYQTMQTLLLDFCQCHPSDALLSALLDMLVDGNFDLKLCPIIQNEDVIILYLSVLQKSSDSLQHQGLNMFQHLLRDSISNRASCVRAGMLTFLLDWFGQDNNDDLIVKIAQLIQVIGGHSVSGKDIRKIFALLRSEKVGRQKRYCSLLMSSILSMLTEKGPTAFFDLSGNNSGILIKTPVQWPINKGFSFSCWLRVENFPIHGTMGLFSFLTENGRGCVAVLAKNKLIYESVNLRRQTVRLHVNIVRKKWHFLCITHSIGRAFSGGSSLKCYVDGDLVSSERCRYAKLNEPLTNCTIGAKFDVSLSEEVDTKESVEAAFPFLGQIGPVYLFSDAISSEQVQGIHSLGPSYMYSFLDNDIATFSENQLPRGILNSKESLASKIIFGLNAQASSGKSLFNVSPTLDLISEKNSFEATAMGGTELCSRRLLQRIIYCVGGVTVLFPLISQSDRYESESSVQFGQNVDVIDTKECLTAEVIELIASVLDENLPNQHQMHLLSGFPILGFLLQSVNPQQLNMETLAALKHLFNVIANCGFSELLIQDAISSIFLNLSIWIYSAYEVQRELYLFLIQQFDNDPRLLKNLCRLPLILDMIFKFYCDKDKCKFGSGSKTSLHPPVGVLGERPTKDEIRKIRLLLLSLGEMSIRQNIVAADIKALIAFFERNQDVTCIEDVLHMVIRAIAQKTVLASFHEQVSFIGGYPIFVNLLQREFEPIRLLSLQFLGRLLVGLPSEKKGLRFFNLPSGKSKSVQESHKKINLRMQPLFSAISDRLFRFPPTDNLCAALFDVLLGGASPKQVLQKQNQSDGQKNKSPGSHFAVPQSLVLIFRFLCSCEDISARLKIITDLLDLLDTNPSNIEAFMEYGWNAWLTASVKLAALQQYKVGPLKVGDKTNEQCMIRKLFSVVLLHCMCSVKGGWQHLEETATFLLMQSEKGQVSFKYFLRDMYEDLIQMLVDLSSGENIFVTQPCRDNALYLLRLIDDMLIAELDHQLPILATVFDVSLDSTELELYISALHDVLQGESDDWTARYSQHQMEVKDDKMDENWWHLYDKLWIIIGEINGKGPNKTFPKSSTSGGPTLGQRARGLVESLNLPAAEMAAVVVSGGLGSALGGKPNRIADKAMLLRSEKFPRIILRLVMLYICKSPLEKASRCAQQFISILPSLVVTDDEQNKNRLQLFIWSLLAVRSQYRMLNNDARIHVISHLIRETVSCCKSILANSIISTDDSSDTGVFLKETGYIHNLIQKERVSAAIADEANYMKTSKIDHEKQLHDLRIRMEESFSNESNSQKVFEDEMQGSLTSILIADDNRRAAFQLAYEEEQQNITEKWMHMFRALIDERGPWSANSSPNMSSTHWKLDKTEDMWRRRPKLRKNYHFDEKLCHTPSISPGADSINAENENKSSIIGHIPEQMKRFLLKGVRKITDEGNSEPIENDAEQCEPNASILKDSSEGQYPELSKDVGDWKDTVQDRKDTSLFSPVTEESEVLMSTPCIFVTPKRKLAGRLAVMKNVLHFFGEFLVEGTGGASTFKNFEVLKSSNLTKLNQRQKSLKCPLYLQSDSRKSTSVDNMEVLNDDGYLKRPLKNVRRHRRWDIGKIKGVHWTRYLLRYTAIEIFFSDSVAPVFFNFDSPKVAKDIGALIVSSRNDYLFPKGSSRSQSGVISFVDRRVALEMAETARESWRRRDITNFEYLMILNTLSGRSYNDLTQYPVFPWVLADYSSEVLDFNKSSTFRDLSKPVGALDLKRFEVFEDRYRNFCDPDIPSFYYGSHYSSMGIVLYYLLRLEPFTSLHRNLQGGKFDHADRLFQSIEGTYRNCLSNTSDVKELIPEFFYLPEFLCNSNHYHLGVKQDGDPIGDVVLPPWAKGSPEVFISRNREALESEYVSSNLHHWIDLVFGYKQRGKPAVEAANVFYYLTYEGAVDLDTMEDDLQRSAIEDQIANFGQTPIQIFRKKHPRRGPPIPIAHPLYFAPGSINLTSIISCSTNPPLAILHISILDTHIVLVSQGLVLTVKMWLTTQLQYGGNFTFSGSQEPFFGVGSDVLSPRKIGSPLAENLELGGQCFATMQTPVENFLVSCGNWDNSFHIISVADGRLLQSIRQHSDVVSCAAVTSDGSILATGSYDTTVMVWKVLRGRSTEKRARSTQSESPRKDYVIAETPFHVLCGHDDIITCLYVSVELDIVISGSKDGTCIFHTLREGRYIRSLHHPSGCGLSKLVASRHGRVVFYADDDLSLHLYSINGKHLAASESNGRLNCVELSQCGEFLVCAGDHGQIVVRSMNSLEVISRYNGIGKVIVSLTVTAEECFLAGTKDGSLLVYSIENPQLRKTSLPRNTKSKPSAAG
ncbi:BEACH domain-containing protein B isoform X3 [Cucumis melo]|uniref:BEACH domain-containing protein B isoform X3 n=1 Tax=Cucumis melo TaxID=3656 RepID=A0ABM3KP15_CUCME|nr:BEACH domain-containing protein B isoform X3 [Cucumis melo]